MQKKRRFGRNYYQFLIIAFFLLIFLLIIALRIQNHYLKEKFKIEKQAQEKLGTTIPLTTSPTLTSVLTSIISKQLHPLVEKLKEKFSPELEPYINYPVKVTLLTQKELDKLSVKQPVIYKGLEAPVYKIEFLRNGKGLLIFYDPSSEKILRKFEITKMKV